jgi:hypothetical protein
MKKLRGVFAKFLCSSDFRDLWNYFPSEKSVDYVHDNGEAAQPVLGDGEGGLR